jgi:uncharacterized protein YjlB
MSQPETYLFADDGRFPNSTLPVLVYRSALTADAGAMVRAFAANGWSNAWQDGIFTFHHFHSISHEVLGIAQGEVQVTLGGPSGETVTMRAGDVVVIPAGVGHRNVGQRRAGFWWSAPTRAARITTRCAASRRNTKRQCEPSPPCLCRPAIRCQAVMGRFGCCGQEGRVDGFPAIRGSGHKVLTASGSCERT